MAEHHEEGMSRWTAWAECPFWTSSGKSSAAAEFGTRAHAYLEALVKGATPPPASSEERDAAGWAHEWVETHANGAEVHSESTVTIADHGACEGIFGTCDLWWVDPTDRHLVVADFKSIGLSDKDYRPQLMGYAYAIASSYEINGWFDLNLPITGIILHGGSHYAEYHSFTIDEAVSTGKRIIEAHRAATEADARCCGSCNYCGRYPCSAVTNRIAVVRMPWVKMNLAQQMDALKELSRIKEYVERKVRESLEAGTPVEDPAIGVKYELAIRKGAAPLADIDGLANVMMGRFGVPREKFLGMVKVSKTALVAEIMDKGLADGAPYTKKEAAQFIEPFFGEAPETKVLKCVNINKKEK